MSKSYQPMRLEIKDLADSGTFTGYASTREKDMVGDIILEGAFKRTIDHNEGKFPILFFHDPERPVGISTRMVEDGRGLYTEGLLNMEVPDGRAVHSHMKMGIIDRLSIGYRTVSDSYDKEQGARLIKEVQLFEYSLVTKNFAAQPNALITNVKSMQWILDLAEEVKEGRVLSTANLRLVENAITALQALLTAATPAPTSGDAHVMPGKAVDGPAESQHAPDDSLHAMLAEVKDELVNFTLSAACREPSMWRR